MFREMEIFLEVQLGIGQCLIPKSALGGVSISEVLSAIATVAEESKIIEYFYCTKWGSINSSILGF